MKKYGRDGRIILYPEKNMFMSIYMFISIFVNQTINQEVDFNMLTQKIKSA